jgi:RsiW-degrading membrane proteinase PrsW (M82 family)
MRWVWLVIGVIAVAVGIVWTLQGLNILGGSVMSGHAIYAVVGLIVAVIGLVLIGVGLRRRRAPSA